MRIRITAVFAVLAWKRHVLQRSSNREHPSMKRTAIIANALIVAGHNFYFLDTRFTH
ncbi:MAG: hypothetical protein OXP75_04495 [Rhodospirillales bacterium]|nr:hypothetical protein [Rhodospirillales bacterium]